MAISCLAAPSRVLVGTALLTAVLLGSGCVSIDKMEPLTRPPAVEPLQLTMGIWYAPELRSFSLHDTTEVFSDYPLGPRTVTAFDHAFAGLFREAVDLNGPNATAAGQSLSGTLEVRPGEAGWTSGSWESASESWVASHSWVGYDLRLRSATGEQIAAWHVNGEGATPPLALRDAAATLVVGFAEEPGVKRWLDGLRVGYHGAAPANAVAAQPASTFLEDQAGGGMVVLSRGGYATSALEQCVQSALVRTGSAPPLVPGQAWRDALFPWFEPGRGPQSLEGMAGILAKPVVRERAATLGARYVVWIDGATTETNKHGAYYLIGAVWWDKETQLRAEVWDLARMDKLGDLNASASGKAIVGAYIILPIPIIPATEREACDNLAKQILPLAKAAPRTDQASMNAGSSFVAGAARELTR